MAVAYASHNTATSSASTSVVVTKPTGLAVGDLMVAHVCSSDDTETGALIDVVSGWTDAGSGDWRISIAGTQCFHQRIIYKVATSGDVAAADFTFTAADTPTTMSGAVYRITGVAATLKIDVFNAGEQIDSATPSIAISITPNFANELLLMFGASRAGNAGPFDTQAIATSNPTWVEDYDSTTSLFAFFGAHASRPEVTATGNVSFNNTGDATTDTIVHIVAIKPTIDQTITPSVIGNPPAATVQTPTIAGSGVVSTSVVTAVASVQSPTRMGQALWSNQGKNTTSWTNQSKS